MCQNPERHILLLDLPSYPHICSFPFMGIQGFHVESSSYRSMEEEAEVPGSHA